MNSTHFCRLCLKISDDLVNIFDAFQDSTIASILTKHFWFQINKDDGLTEWLCQICWIHTKTFHIFYKRTEFCHRNYYRSTDLESADSINRSVTTKEEVLEPDLNIVKCEETELTVVEMQISKENSSNHNDDNDCDESEYSQTSDDEAQSFNKKIKNDDIRNVDDTDATESRSDTDKEDAQMREFCTMKCDICNDVEFETLKEARKHYKSVHKIRGYLMCCGKKFKYRYRILEHINSHVNPDACRCDQCGKHLPNKSSLKLHLNIHVPTDLRAYICSLCSKSFAKPGTLKNHVQNQHISINGEMFPCDKCNKKPGKHPSMYLRTRDGNKARGTKIKARKFRSELLLVCHIRNVHEYSLKYVCEICARRFKTKTILKTHTESMHSRTPRPKVQCNICGAWLINERGLQKHQQRHDRQPNDVVNCPICEKVVKDEKLLRNHIRYVHGERQHQCVLCDKAFKTAKVLKEHIATHTGEDLYNCKYCEKKFKSNANMFSHRKKAHLAELTRDFPQRTLMKEISTK